MSRTTVAAVVIGSMILGAGGAYASGALDGWRDGLGISGPVAIDEQPVEPVAELTAEPVTTPDAATPTPTDTPEATPSPTPSPTPTGPTPEELAAQAEERDRIKGIQRKLTDLRYYAGAIDGERGPRTTAAVMAFQKVQRIGADGVPGPKTEAALADPVAPALKGGESTRIEVDLDRQVVYLVKGGQLVRILNGSSGSGDSYETKRGNTARSLTPVGDFRIQRRIVGERKADLGVLYDPLYFYKGWALHGSNHVPAYPASHGCIRLQRWDATWLAGQVPNGTQVRLYGGTHTFPIGSSAPGTDAPAGDTPSDTPSEDPSASPSPSDSPSPSPEPTASPSPSQSPSQESSPSEEPSEEPQPSESPSSEPSPSASPSDEPSDEPSPSSSPSESEPDVIPTPSGDEGQ